MPQPPEIDARTRDAILRQLKRDASRYSAWRGGDEDVGLALLDIFSHMVESVQERLNRVPEKNFLAFLNLIGVDALPPQPARVPLTFSLAEGSREGTRVPAWTQITGALEDGTEIYFETERDIYLNPTRITGVFSREPSTDQYADYGDLVLGTEQKPISIFEGLHPIPHILYIACDDLFTLPATKTITLTFETADATELDALPLQWSYWDGAAWQTLTVEDGLSTHYLWHVRIESCPTLQPSIINGIEACWLRAELLLPLAPTQIAGETILHLSETVLELKEFEPFDPLQKFPLLFHLKLADDEVVRMVFNFQFAQYGTPTDNLVLAWEYFNGTKWATLSAGFEDKTANFTLDGAVTFDLPADWAQDYEGGWIRVRIQQGTFNRAEESLWPQIKSLTCEYQYQLRDLPQVERISVSAELLEQALATDRAYSNTQPLDLSADIFPFGLEPHFNTTFYLTCDTAFSKPDAEVRINITLNNPSNIERAEAPFTVNASENLVLTWEMWNGQQWEGIGHSTPRQASAGTTAYGFHDTTFCLLQDGYVQFRLPWGVQPVTLNNGDTGYWLRVRLIQGNYGVASQYQKRGDGGYDLIEATYRPPVISQISIDYFFTPVASPQHALCYNDFQYEAIGSDPFIPFHRSSEVDPVLYLAVESTIPSRGIAFNNAPATLFVEVDGVFTRNELDEIANNANLEPPQTMWEYSSVNGWQPLRAEDETHAFTESGLVSFIGAADAVQREEFGKIAYWLRVRPTRGKYRVLPRLRNLLLNTMWGVQGVRTSGRLLGSATNEPHQQFWIEADATILEGQQVEVREGDEWVIWQEASDFYASSSNDRHYTLNRKTGEIRFGDGNYGMIPPSGANNVRVTYRTGGGRVGNIGAEQITQLKSSIPRLAAVKNVIASSGGAESELITRAQERGPKVLRHQQKAVTADDYVDLAYETLGVKMAQAITPKEEGAVGQVGLIIVPDTDDPRPTPSLGLIDRLRKKLLEAAPPTVDIWITSPDWLCVSVVLEFAPRTLGLAVATKNEIERCLTNFFHPITGYYGRGWTFGRYPQRSDIYALIEALPGVDHITYLDVRQSWENEPRENRVLVYSGTHWVTIAD
jgi:hypothetical protein